MGYDKCSLFTITDAYGDGICCQQTNGGYKVEEYEDAGHHAEIIGGGTYINKARDGNPGSENDLKKKKVEDFCTGTNPNAVDEEVPPAIEVPDIAEDEAPVIEVPDVEVPDVEEDKDPKTDCDDKKGSKFTWKKNKKITCQHVKKDNKCSKFYKGPNEEHKANSRKLWYFCAKSCEKCDKLRE